MIRRSTVSPFRSPPRIPLKGAAGRDSTSNLGCQNRVVIVSFFFSLNLWLAGCSGTPSPILTPLKQMTSKTPVVYVPGSTGTELRDRESKVIIWGRGRQLILPRDDGYAIARPLHLGLKTDESRLEVMGAIHRIRLAGFSQDVYGPIADALVANGYQLGDLEAPRPDDTAFLFGYDWRLDHRLAAARLLERLEALREARGEERLEVDFICQSNGAYICRYLVKYGDARLEEAEAGTARRPERVDVRKMVLMGNSNGGSIRMLREIHRGRSYIKVVGRKMRPEVLFSGPAFYQDLPMVRSDLFLDADGEPMDVDIFDAESWRRFGWSIFSPAARKRIARNGASDVFGDEAQQMEFLAQVLDRAKRLHLVLNKDVPSFGATRYYMLQSNSLETPDRAVLVKNGNGWETLFTGDKKLQRMGELHALATAPGDGHGTVDSQMWLSPQEKQAMAAEPYYIDDEHFDLILKPETHRRLLDYLYDGSPARASE